jgi:DNA-binding MarR family transcriptional regulator
MTRKEPNVHEVMVVQVMRTAEILRVKIGTLLKEYELTPAQYNIMRILRGAKMAISLGEVKERMHVDTSDVSRLIDRLVKKDLVGRNICPENRRKLDVCISESGLATLIELDKKMSENLDGFYAEVISREKAKEITEVLSWIGMKKEVLKS